MKKEICWNITSRCNQNCKYCHRFLNIKELSFNDNMTILSKLINMNVKNITWTGGEALLFDGIDELLAEAYNHGIKNKLITNGKLLTNERIDKIFKYLDSVTLSIDSINDNINDDLGRGYNHFQEIKDILDYLEFKNYNVKIRINSVVCRNNLDGFKELVKFLNNYNIYSWRLFKFIPLRETAKINKELFDITNDEYEEAVSYIKKNSNCLKIDTRIPIDMENKYVLILANGDVVKTLEGEDVKIGNAIVNPLKNML